MVRAGGTRRAATAAGSGEFAVGAILAVSRVGVTVRRDRASVASRCASSAVLASQAWLASIADGTTERASAVVAVKTEPLPCQAIKVRGINVGVAVGSDRIRPLVISEQENDIGQLVRLQLQADRKDKGGDDDGLFHEISLALILI